MIRVYTEYYVRRYYAYYFSSGTVCCVLGFLLTLIVPLVLAISSNQFWIRTAIFYEQPQVSYNGGIFLNILGKESKSYCSVNSVNQDYKSQSLSLAPIIFVQDQDLNNDGYNDIIIVNITVPYATQTIKQINMIIGLDYALNQTGNIQMSSGVFVSFYPGAGASLIKSTGDVIFKQRNSIYVTNSIVQLYQDENIFNQLQAKGFISLFDSYFSRNESLSFKHVDSIGYSGNTPILNIEIKMSIPLYQEVLYQMPLLEAIKISWVQYLAILIPIFMIVYYGFFWTAYRHRIVDAAISDDVTMSNIEKMKTY